jgi:alpha-D-ribose 1-methylphosphonate 5-triphosphate synthase subunit PhnI
VTADASDGEGFTWPPFPKVSDTLRDIGSIAPLPEQSPEETPFDITRESLRFPVPRSAWLQSMARGETAAMVCLAYSNLRGYGYADHGTIGEVRVGSLPVRILHPVTGAAVTIGSFEATECEMFGPEGDAPVTGAKGRLLPAFGLSYGLVIGRNERKAIAMSILDSALQAGELASIDGGEVAPSNDQEMVLSHIDGIESTGFVEHLKLPHYVTFGSQIRTQMSPRRDVMLAAERTLAGITPEVATERGTGDE